eukprot:TRINITY_DN3286_c0_g1_i1.p1 TRINITY_DN3286_c0_g1~~TRINITY_DN3286_c0_g1_i1.p1  ORF type:complete len:223 (-),score=30.64 TRINITY_DN3286_c0_g1_i1:184-852(-)
MENSSGIQERGFEPYDNHGGTCIAIAGKDYCIIGADTRMSTGYSILSRKASKLYELSPKIIFAGSGCQGDRDAFQKLLVQKRIKYKQQHFKEMGLDATAQVVSRQLYGRRLFPYYVFSITGGMNEKGEGVVYAYDAVGSYHAEGWCCTGTGSALVIPLLDSLLGKETRTAPIVDHTLEQSLEIFKQAFTSCGERDIFTGDYVEILIITKDETRREVFELKFD